MKPSIYWIDGPWPGRLGIMTRPRGGDWLEDEVSSWKSEKVDLVVCTLTRGEVEEFELAKEEALCLKKGLAFVSFPIGDREVPASLKAVKKLVQELEQMLQEGKKVVIHCRQGIGRSAVLAAGVLVLAGVEPETALDRISKSRGVPVPDTVEQRQWMQKFAKELVSK